MTDDAAPITRCDDTVVIRGAALPLLCRCTLALIQRRHRDGLSASPLLIEACRTLYRACMSRERHFLASNTVAESSWRGQNGEHVDSAEAPHRKAPPQQPFTW